jgi:hypothetical protein
MNKHNTYLMTLTLNLKKIKIIKTKMKKSNKTIKTPKSNLSHTKRETELKLKMITPKLRKKQTLSTIKKHSFKNILKSMLINL